MSKMLSIPIAKELTIIMKDIEEVHNNFFLAWLGDVIRFGLDLAYIEDEDSYKSNFLHLAKLGWKMANRNIEIDVFAHLLHEVVNKYSEISVNYSIGPGTIQVIGIDAESIKIMIKETLDEYPVEQEV